MNRRAQADVAPARSRARNDFVLERHSYSGGLRVELLGNASARPDWVPPSDYVGFRNELGLLPRDYVVEFARFAYRSRKVTWIAVFGHAVDQVYGDRQNHAGVGVWLADHDVLYAEPLLKSLRGFADLARKGEDLGVRPDEFREGFLPDFLQPSLNLPSALHGWPFVTGPVADTAMFVATNGAEEDGWKLAADQLLRATLLPPPTPAHARALILVRPAGEPDSAPEGAKPVAPLSAPEIIKVLPQALTAVVDENRSAQTQMGQLSERCRALETELDSERRRHAEKAEQAAHLQEKVEEQRAELDGNDQHRIWSAIKGQMRDVSDQVARNSSLIELAHRDVIKHISALPKVGPAIPGDPPGHKAAARTETPVATEPDEAWTRGETILFWVLVAVATALVIAFGYVIYSQVSVPAVSPVE